jgi:uncharacterized membrane protein YeaQ/YmgE (transglycosylase-associated protein family)
MMKKGSSPLPFLLVGGFAGMLAGLLLPTEQRDKVSRQLAGVIRGMVEHMPDG